MNPLVAQLSHKAFPQLADALRSRIDHITREWIALSKEAMPQLDRLTFDEMKDSTPTILAAIADAMASADTDEIKSVLSRSPAQGLSRFHQKYDVIVVMQEDRLLRAVVVTQIEDALDRQLNAAEAAALHATVDVMLQQSVIALVEEQKTELGLAAERELKYLSFLSHDLNNNLGGVTLMLKLLRDELTDAGTSLDAVELIDDAERGIATTVDGMRRLLEHERMRKVGAAINAQQLGLRGFLERMVQHSMQEASSKGLNFEVNAETDATCNTDSDMLSLVMQNLIGNAIKFSSAGTVRLGAERQASSVRLSVTDEGPGIASEDLTRIFGAFERGKVFGQKGVGLGLAIASQAAKILNATLTVKSTLGKGSTFYVSLPAR